VAVCPAFLPRRAHLPRGAREVNVTVPGRPGSVGQSVGGCADSTWHGLGVFIGELEQSFATAERADSADAHGYVPGVEHCGHPQ
jgi:hypothetical protein